MILALLKLVYTYAVLLPGALCYGIGAEGLLSRAEPQAERAHVEQDASSI